MASFVWMDECTTLSDMPARGITRVPGVPSQRPKAEKRYQQLYYRTNAAAVHERSTAGVLQVANAEVNVCR